MTHQPSKSNEEIIEALWRKFKSVLGSSSIDNRFNSMYDLEGFVLEVIKAKDAEREKAVEEERERIIAILQASYLPTNGYKDTDTVRTAMYIPNEAFNIEINKRLDFFIEQINPT